jgi:cysteine-rich repeat protein
MDNVDPEDTLMDLDDPGCYSNGNTRTGTYNSSDDDETHTPSCGNGAVDQTSEECDDGNVVNGDGCKSTCHREYQCNDGIDNDGDTRIDFGSDPGCSALSDDDEFNTYECNDDLDNDFDNAVDVDGRDSNGDGDFTDPGELPPDFSCDSQFDESEGSPLAQCQDGINNDDGDSVSDYPADPGCDSTQDNDERNACGDGEDNDGDGFSDFPADDGCRDEIDANERGPSLTILSPTEGSSFDQSSVTVMYALGVDVEGVVRIGYVLDGSQQIFADHTSTLTLTGLTDGQHTLSVTAANSSDALFRNAEATDSVVFTVALPAQCSDGLDNDGDTKVDFGTDSWNDPDCRDGEDRDERGPRITIISPTAGSTITTNSTTVTYTKSDDLQGVEKVLWSLDGVTFTDGGNTGSFPLSNLRNGSYTITVVAADANGNPFRNLEATATISFTVNSPACGDLADNDGDGKTDYGTGASNDPGCESALDNSELGPRVTITASLDGSIIGTFSTNITYTISDDTLNVAKVLRSLDSAPYVDVGIGGSFTLTNLTEGDHTLSVAAARSNDTLFGNTEAQSTITFTVDVPECSDRIDNDSDGVMDHPADPGCSDANDNDEKNACSDAIDNDGDLLTDFGTGPLNDPGCQNAQDMDERNACTDGVDNDGDGLTDFGDEQTNDPGCSDSQDVSELNACGDGVDNDSDGAMDCNDFSCRSGGACDPQKNDEASPPSECQDSLDNDGDGFRDFRVDGTGDPGCSSAQDNDEFNLFQCNDGMDNDNDGASDCSDFSCLRVDGTCDPYDNREDWGLSACQNGLDDDGDNLTDYPSDGGCSDQQDNMEEDQCADAIDNDGDGTKDYGVDPSNDNGCESFFDNSESGSVLTITSPVDGSVQVVPDITVAYQTGGDMLNVALVGYALNGGAIIYKSPVNGNFTIQNLGEGTYVLQVQTARSDGSLFPNPESADSVTFTVYFANCNDGVDNDSDGAEDCQDIGCLRDDGTCDVLRKEDSRMSQCQDTSDNDGDGAVDCQDFSCLTAGGICNPQKNDEASPPSECQDSLDNDGDGFRDFRVNGTGDPGCSSAQDNDEFNLFQCNDGMDNDNDGASDCSDFSCRRNDGTCNPLKDDESQPPAQCQDGRDNDGDGAVDEAGDFSCDGSQDNDEAFPVAECQDSLDNDGDGLTDLSDPGCDSSQDGVEYNPRLCRDGRDNDGDGLTDFPNDPGCTSPHDNTEMNAECSDVFENDDDSAVDYPLDFSCFVRWLHWEAERAPKAWCQDGKDNDNDGLIDFGEDPGCRSLQDHSENDIER